MAAQNDKNYGIDFWKFYYMFILVLYHFYSATDEHFIGGTYGVEFFVLTSGVFFFQFAEKQLEKEPMMTPNKYFVKRFLRFFPWTTVAFFVLVFVKRFVIKPISLGKLADHFSKEIWDVLLLSMSGLNNSEYPLNVPAWTISSILIVQFIMYCFWHQGHKKFIHLILPVSIIFTSAYYISEFIGLRHWVGFTTSGTLRVWFEIGLGYYGWQIAKQLRGIHFNENGKRVLTVIELLAHGGALWIILNRNSMYYLLLSLLFFLVAVSIGISGNSLFSKWMGKIKISAFFAPFSLALYLMQNPVLTVYKWVYQDAYVRYEHIVDFLICIGVVSIVYYFVVKFLIKITVIIKNKLADTLIEGAAK